MTRSDPSSAAPAPRALITGVNGFTGRYMAAHLAADGYRVWGTVRAGESIAANELQGVVTPLAADLLDREALAHAVETARPDVVVHLAAIANVADGDVARTYVVNVVGTRNLLETVAQQQHVPRAVLIASSANVYGNVTPGMIDETVAPQPANDYAVSKLAMEYVAKRWNAQLPLVIARPFNYTGVGQSTDFLLPKIVEHYARGDRTISLGNIDVSRDFSDVRDVVDAYARLIAVAPRGKTVNVCSGTGWTLGEILASLARIAGYSIEVKIDPRFVRANEVRHLVGSNAKLRTLIGESERRSIEETLRWMYEDARKRLGKA
ncbi:SDR family NAD(P)-dependent oxidoreductase [Paraburkholderia sp. Ac-20340]|uniref:SDR family NAD(P)-dependent oxidoreductase n=1 Tax=Paraburkholderia sp. Ac-20340 TaxID=2703888 RepID=UPI00198100DA|nr:SDR family NAD(P)-dependent oxidoreductase [Paraburkholderia sp. Ac-20340]MBN3853620.1 SDR family NAD(P)-dependent oxidoreductase [Paraburkholderia sp. Ac-20340]